MKSKKEVKKRKKTAKKITPRALKKSQKLKPGKEFKAKQPEEKGPALIVIALGGNTLIKKGQKGTYEEQTGNLKVVCSHIASLVKKGHKVVITHGNGPQVGDILIQQEAGEGVVPKMPLDVCGAQSQAAIGYFIQQTLQNELSAKGIRQNVVTITTRVVVDQNDHAFKNPTKPIGPFYTKEKAGRIAAETGCKITKVNDSEKGWRMVVPSPDPKEILELLEIRKLAEAHTIVICCGGGGIPVFRDRSGALKGVEAVIDKDLSAELLASKLGAHLLAILTDVRKVAVGFGTEFQKNLDSLSVKDAKRYLGHGEFAHGSMGPKIEAAIRFAQSGKHRKTIVAQLDELEKAVEGKAGTTITLGGEAQGR